MDEEKMLLFPPISLYPPFKIRVGRGGGETMPPFASPQVRLCRL